MGWIRIWIRRGNARGDGETIERGLDLVLGSLVGDNGYNVWREMRTADQRFHTGIAVELMGDLKLLSTLQTLSSLYGLTPEASLLPFIVLCSAFPISCTVFCLHQGSRCIAYFPSLYPQSFFSPHIPEFQDSGKSR